MAPYYIIFIILSLFALTDLVIVKKDQRLVLFFVSYTILVLFAGFRYYPLQQDFAEYTRNFVQIAQHGLSAESIFEPGYVLLMWIVSRFTASPAVFFIIVAMIGIGLNFFAISRFLPKYLFLAIIFYFVHTYILREMGAVRSGIAAGLCFISLIYIRNAKPYKFLAVMGCALCFHLASVIFLIVYPVYKLNWRPRTMFFLVLGSLVIGYLAPFGNLLASAPFIGSVSRIAGYAQSLSEPLGILTNPTTLKQLFFTLAGLCFYNRLNERVPSFSVIFLPYMLSVCWLMVWNDFPIVAGRMATFLSVTEVVLLPSFLSLFEKMSKPIIMIIFIFLALTILYMNGNYYLTIVEGYLPYQTIFTEQ